MIAANDLSGEAKAQSREEHRYDSKPRGRFTDIDRLKGLGIILVVWGHVPSALISVPDIRYYITISMVYAFHMPLFFYLSGFVFFLSGAPNKFFVNPLRTVAARFDRLIIPVVLFGTTIIIGKYIVGEFFELQKPVDSILVGLKNLVTNPPENPLMSVWYLIVLFIYSVISPSLWIIAGRRISLILLMGIFAWLFELTDYYEIPNEFYARNILIYYIFFGIGGFVAINHGKLLPQFQKFWAPSLSIFAACLYLTYTEPFALLSCGITSAIALHGLFLQRRLTEERFFLWFGQNTMAIYLLNTIFIGVCTITLRPLWGAFPGSYAILVGAIFLTGLLGPITARVVSSKIKILRPLVRYIE
ncbi:acyltransferase family protein [Erythrobacter sp.]|uniref:acyltransferase family protein n=1 Tax=Erythrobacter sp. TaxID=1042 RepID=UPI0025E84EFA|nr:acyltransferase [Erythrobacter sp.]